MSVHVVIQPAAGYGAEVIAPLPGVRQLVAGSDEVGVTVQVPARIVGLTDAARFARALAVAANDFAVQPLTGYQSQEGKARNRPVRPRINEQTGRRIYRATIADPSPEKERDKSIAVDIVADVQPVPPEAVANLPFRPVVLEGLTVQPRAEASGRAKWITWVVRATGLRAVDAPSTGRGGSAKSAGGDAGKSAA